MKQRAKLLAAAAALAGLVLLLGLGTTLAGGSSVIEVRSRIETDQIGIALRLSAADEGRSFTNMEPGRGINKDPLIANTGDRPVYIRVRVEVSSDLEEERDLLSELEVTWQDGWLDGGDSWLYYTEVLEAGEETGLFQNRSADPANPYTIRFPGAWTQDTPQAKGTAPKMIQIDITPQAIQAEHFAPDFERGGFWAGAGDD